MYVILFCAVTLLTISISVTCHLNRPLLPPPSPLRVWPDHTVDMDVLSPYPRNLVTTSELRRLAYDGDMDSLYAHVSDLKEWIG